MSFLIRDEKLIEKYNEIWKKVSNIIKKPVYKKKKKKKKKSEN